MEKYIIKTVRWGLLLSLFFALYSCQNDYRMYDSEIKDCVYFVGSDSVDFKFGMSKGEIALYEIPVGIIGMPKDYDRKLGIEIIRETTTAVAGKHYDIIDTTLVVKAGKVGTTIAVNLYRYMDTLMVDSIFTLNIRLMENESFRINMAGKLKLSFSDTEMPQPRWWDDGHFGPYSQMLMLDVFYYYWQLEETHPALFDRIVAEYGRNLEKAFGFPYQQEIAFIKYIITPMYEYYQAHPNAKVEVPDPATLL